MNADLPHSPAVTRDAANRAVRTFVQGLLFDVAAAVGVALTVAIADGIEWTRMYWLALAAAVGKSIVTAAVSYFARRMVPPAAGGVS